MGVKKQNLQDENLIMERNGYLYQIQYFDKGSMRVDTLVYKDGKFIQKESLPFAQLTKSLKKLLN